MLTFRAEELYGAFRRAEEEVPEPSAPSEAFGLLFTTSSTMDERSHILVYLDEEGKIVSIDFVFWSLQEHLEKLVGEWLIAPQQTAAMNTADSLHVAFVAQDGIQLWDSDTVSTENLVTAGDITGLIMSHDGRRIAYTRRDADGRVSLWAADLDTGLTREQLSADQFLPLNLTENVPYSVQPHHLAWIPETHELAFSTLTSPQDGMPEVFHELRVLNADTGVLRLLLDDEAGGTFTYSPDGAHIALVSDGGVSLLRADGTAVASDIIAYPPLMVIDNQHHPVVSWHSDAHSFLLAVPQTDDGLEALVDPSVVSTIWQIGVDGSAVERGTITGLALDPLYSPDLTQVGFTHGSPVSSRFPEVHVARTDGSGNILYGSGSFHSWQPGGQGFMFFTETGQPHTGRVDEAPVPLPPMWKGYDQPASIEWIDDRTFLYSLADGRLFLGDLQGESEFIGYLRPEKYLAASSLRGFDFHPGS